jgi:hypothetical protein
MMKVCERCGQDYMPASGSPDNILWRRRKYCSRSCAQTRHGLSRSYENRVWCNMLTRCTNPNATGYNHYGGRGISVCAEWQSSFALFLQDMGPAPTKKHSIERRDNEKGYDRSNCYWATRKDQMRNTRRSKMVTFRGETKNLSAWCEELGLSYWTIHSRIHKLGWSAEDAFIKE